MIWMSSTYLTPMILPGNTRFFVSRVNILCFFGFGANAIRNMKARINSVNKNRNPVPETSFGLLVIPIEYLNYSSKLCLSWMSIINE